VIRSRSHCGVIRSLSHCGVIRSLCHCGVIRSLCHCGVIRSLSHCGVIRSLCHCGVIRSLCHCGGTVIAILELGWNKTIWKCKWWDGLRLQWYASMNETDDKPQVKNILQTRTQTIWCGEKCSLPAYFDFLVNKASILQVLHRPH